MKKLSLILTLLFTTMTQTSDFSIPIINKTIHPVVVTIISHSKDISSIEVPPTVKNVQQFCAGLKFNSIKYIVIQRPIENLPQIIRYPYIYEAQKACIKCHTQHNAITSWSDVVATALNENYCSGKSVSSTTEQILHNNIIVNKKDITMALNGIFKSINYDKLIADIERSLSSNIKKINKSIETISMILEDIDIMKTLHISNHLIKKLEIKTLELSETLSSLSPLLTSLQDSIMNIDMISSIIKKKNFNQNDLTTWKKELNNSIEKLESTKSLPIAKVKLVAQKIKELENKYNKTTSQINKLLVVA